MVFTTTNLFKGIACPEEGRCALTNCIYSHEPTSYNSKKIVPSVSASNELRRPTSTVNEAAEPAGKRRKITYESLAEKPPSRADLIRNQLAAVKAKSSDLVKQQQPSEPPSISPSSQPLASLVKPISPPPSHINGGANARPPTTPAAVSNNGKHDLRDSSASKKAQKVESLNPRLIPNDPAGHQKRSLYLRYLHSEMVRLNQLVKDASGLDFKRQLSLSEQDIISLALDEEEKVAREQPALYGNIIKSRVAALKKISIDDWVKYVKTTYAIDQPTSAKKQEKVIETGLPLEQEHLILPSLVADQKPLAAFGYIPNPPTEAEAAEAAAAVEASKNYEICDRCAARFQVFPDRNEEGLIASNGPCRFHPLRKVFPQRSKTDKETGQPQPYYPCCRELIGAAGCTSQDEHVFKTSSPARLAAILPFMTTPENPSPTPDRNGKTVQAVTFDCEMGYTAYGLELIRLTAVSWPSGNELLDILVRPLGAVIDLNSRFSGVFAEHFAKAIPYDEWKSSTSPPTSSTSDPPRLPIVDSPRRARSLLCSFLTPSTPLIGHAIDNDLNTVRLCHPTIIDTVVLYAHPRGLPMRFGLKMLTQRHLHRAIQTGGERGHDSLEDAVATGDLVRVEVGRRWKQLRSSGWQIINDQLVPPSRSKLEGVETQPASAETIQVAGQKRKKSVQSTGSGDEKE